MKARIRTDGTAVTISLTEIGPVELVVIIESLQAEAARRESRAMELESEARDRRELSDRVRRGRHANRRTAGELEAEAKKHDLRAEAAMDMIRVLRPVRQRVEAQSNAQLVAPSQIKEG
ncbi:MAG TPA: hypothetical protein VFZ21_25985 [Gemmatimonadaceae bacterium]|nr:hypothetical protein [Gemmatimonadaceae bacterium]